jgi:hypothetical protein
MNNQLIPFCMKILLADGAWRRAAVILDPYAARTV